MKNYLLKKRIIFLVILLFVLTRSFAEYRGKDSHAYGGGLQSSPSSPTTSSQTSTGKTPSGSSSSSSNGSSSNNSGIKDASKDDKNKGDKDLNNVPLDNSDKSSSSKDSSKTGSSSSSNSARIEREKKISQTVEEINREYSTRKTLLKSIMSFLKKVFSFGRVSKVETKVIDDTKFDFAKDVFNEALPFNEEKDIEKVTHNMEKLREDVFETEEVSMADTTVGDPVLLGSGQFYTKSDDTGFVYGKQRFTVSRTLISSRFTGGAFGKEWVSNLDTRIIRGTDKSEAEAYIGGIAENYTLIKNYKQKLLSLGADPSCYEKLLLWEKELKASEDAAKDMISRASANSLYNTYTRYGYEAEEKKLPSSCILFIEDDGSEVLFSYNYETKRYDCVSETLKNRMYIKENSDGGFSVCYINGFVKVYNKMGLPVYFCDRYGMSISFLYADAKDTTATPNIQSVMCGKKEMLHLFWNKEGRLERVYNDFSKQSVSYRYDLAGRLLGYTDSFGDMYSYAYTSSGLLSAMVKPDGATTEISYASSSGNKFTVCSVKNDEGYAEHFSCKLDDTNSGSIVYTDADGVIRRYTVSSGKVIRKDFADNSFAEWTYSEEGFVSAKSDMYGKVRYEYDSYGNMIKAIYADGSNETWIYREPYNLLSSYTDRDGITTAFLYDSKGSVSEISRSGKTAVKVKCSLSGQIASYDGIIGHNEFSYGDNYSVCKDLYREYFYDEKQRLVKIVNKEGYEWKWDYSEDGKTVTNILPGNLMVKKIYDNRKNMILSTETDMLTGECRVFEYEYDKRHLPLSIKAGLGENESAARKKLRRIREFSYYPSGKIKSVDLFDKSGVSHRISYAYKGEESYSVNVCIIGSDGKLKEKAGEIFYSVSYKDGLKLVSESRNGVVQFFDWRGNIVKVADAEGRFTSYTFSKGGKPLSYTNFYGGTFTYKTDFLTGKIDSISDNKQVLQKYVYSSDGKLLMKVEADGFTSKYEYENKGNVFIVREKNALSTKEAHYDSLSRLVYFCIRDTRGKILEEEKVLYNAKTNTVTEYSLGKKPAMCKLNAWGKCIYDFSLNEKYSYDEEGRCIAIENGERKAYIDYDSFSNIVRISQNGFVKEWEYNSYGKPVLCKYQGEILWQGKYDERGMLIEEKGSVIPQKRYAYDKSGLLIAIYEGDVQAETYSYSKNLRDVCISDAEGKNRYEKYDVYGRLIEETNRLGKTKRITYSLKDDAVSCTDFNGNTVCVTGSASRGKISSAYKDGTKDIIYFDAAGSVLALEGKAGRTEYVYNNMHRLEKIKGGSSPISYKASEDGSSVAIGANGFTANFLYNSDGSLQRLFADDFACAFEYDMFGNETLSRDSSGTSIVHRYDGMGREVFTEHRDMAGNVIFFEELVYGKDGRIVSAKNKNGETLYSYDASGRLYSVKAPYSQEYDNAVREELFECGFDVENKTAQNTFWEEFYIYDKNGNRIEKRTPLGNLTYSYDAENRLISVNGPKKIEYSYDDNGNMLRMTSPYRRLEWKYDYNNRVSYSSVADYKEASYVTSEYLYDSLGRVSVLKDSSGKKIEYAYDGTGFNVLYEKVSSNVSYAEHNSMSTSTASEGVRFMSTERFEKSRSSKSVSSHCDFDRFFVYANGNICFQIAKNYGVENVPSASAGIYRFALDFRGSVRSASDKNGSPAFEKDYTVDGKPFTRLLRGYASENISERLAAQYGMDIGFLSKEYDADAGLYRFGFRDYAPSIARFVTSDPVRDGRNWYAYCAGDPINFIDTDGLLISSPKINGMMQEYEPSWNRETRTGTLLLGNSETSYVYLEGCYLNAMTGVLNRLLGKLYDLTYLNEQSKIFCSETSGEINTDAFAEEYNLVFDYWTKEKQGCLSSKIDMYASSETEYVLVIKVHYSPSNSNATHWVGVRGNVVTINGTEYVEIEPTSLQDKYSRVQSHDSRCDWWLAQDETVYLPVEEVLELRAFSRGANAVVEKNQ